MNRDEVALGKQPKSVIFVGGFGKPRDGTEGGQNVACRTLMETPLSHLAEWSFIDTTQRSQPPPNLAIRVADAGGRLLSLLRLLWLLPMASVLIFSSYGDLGFLEKGLMCVLSRLWGRRVVLSLRSEVKPQRTDWLLGWYGRMVLRSCAVVWCQTERAATSLAAIVGGARLPTVVIPNWIDAQSYQRPATYRRVPGAPVRFLFCGWLESFKGVHELVEALPIVQESGLRWELTLCGGGSQRQSLERRVVELGLGSQVHFAGWVRGAEKLAAFWEADVFVLPSHSEGLPNALLEAMAARLPIVASRVGGIPAVVQNKVNGLLVAPRAIPELARALLDLGSEPEVREQMGALNEVTIRRDHDVAAIWPRVARTLDLDPGEPDLRHRGLGVSRGVQTAV